MYDIKRERKKESKFYELLGYSLMSLTILLAIIKPETAPDAWVNFALIMGIFGLACFARASIVELEEIEASDFEELQGRINWLEDQLFMITESLQEEDK